MANNPVSSNVFFNHSGYWCRTMQKCDCVTDPVCVGCGFTINKMKPHMHGLMSGETWHTKCFEEKFCVSTDDHKGGVKGFPYDQM